MMKEKYKRLEYTAVGIISILYALFLLSPVLLTIPKTPVNTVNMMAGHYFEDYYEYLSFIKQGQEGNLLLRNQFTGEDNSPLFVSWWPYSVLGLASNIIRLKPSPMAIYWTGSGILIFILFLLHYKAIGILTAGEKKIKRWAAFLLIITASPLYEISRDSGRFIVNTYDYWYSNGTPFARYSAGIPHHIAADIILLSALIHLSKQNKKCPLMQSAVIFILFSLLIFIASPPYLILYWLTKLASLCIYLNNNKKGLFQREIIAIVISIAVVIPVFLLIQKYFLSSPTISLGKKFDIVNFINYPAPKSIVFTAGILMILAPFSLPIYFRKVSFPRILFFFIFFFSFFLACINIPEISIRLLIKAGFHNLRFLTSLSYIFLGVAVVEFLDWLYGKKIRFIAAGIIIMLINFPSINTKWQLAQNISLGAGQLQFMPAGTYQGLALLLEQQDEKTVLTSPSSLLGLAVPALSNKTVFTGRSILTFRHAEKQQEAEKFYRLIMTEKEAREFLDREKIGYIITAKGFDPDKGNLTSKYPFLTDWYHNSQMAILTIKNKNQE